MYQSDDSLRRGLWSGENELGGSELEVPREEREWNVKLRTGECWKFAYCMVRHLPVPHTAPACQAVSFYFRQAEDPLDRLNFPRENIC